MANLTESSTWEPGIYQWEITDPVEGGAGGIDNLPTRQLANRTRWLLNSMIQNLGGVPAIQSGPLANRPAAGTAGRLYLATDTTPLPRIDRDSGTAWVPVGGEQYGTNTNGSYLRFENGVQLCWGRFPGFGALESNANSITWTYPAAFVDVPIIQATGASNVSGYPVLLTPFGNSITGSSASITAYMPSGRPNYTSAECLAIGRWK